MEQSFIYHSQIQEIPKIRKDLSGLQTKWKIPAPEMKQIMLIIEEIFSNIIRYAFDGSQDHQIELRIQYDPDSVTMEFIDDGPPFNPAEYTPVPFSDPAAAQTGGMGLTLVRAFASAINYTRAGNHNHLRITKEIKSQQES